MNEELIHCFVIQFDYELKSVGCFAVLAPEKFDVFFWISVGIKNFVSFDFWPRLNSIQSVNIL